MEWGAGLPHAVPNNEELPGDEALMLLARQLQEAAVAYEMAHSSCNRQEAAVAAMNKVVVDEHNSYRSPLLYSHPPGPPYSSTNTATMPDPPGTTPSSMISEINESGKN